MSGISSKIGVAPGQEHGEVLLELRGITKSFPGVLANDEIDLDIRAGEVHALLGENGAGKSTLVSILSGMYQPDAGEIRFDGHPVEIDSPHGAIELGIGTVYQHLTLVPTLSVLENLMLGSEDGVGRLGFEAARQRFDELAELLGGNFPPEARTGSLALGQQQQVEIMKALWRGDSRVLILDEPTSMLTPKGYESLRDEVKHLVAGGLALILITHKLHEAIDLGDRVSVLRRGRRVGAVDPDELASRTEEEISRRIVSMMFGEQAPELGSVEQTDHRLPADRKLGPTVVEVRGIGLDPDHDVTGLNGIEFEIRSGEILGIAGVDGNGQRELAEIIAGQRRPDAGEVRFEGEDVTRLDVKKRARLGLRYITDDRLGEGTVKDLDVAMNAVLRQVGQPPFWRHGAERRPEIDRFAADLVQRFDVRTPDLETRIANLSGGNIQKLLLAREFAGDPKMIVFNKPTHGLDVRTAEFVRDHIRDAAASGLAALVISTELDELVGLCDRIVVMSRGEVTGVVENRPGVEEEIGHLMMARTDGVA